MRSLLAIVTIFSTVAAFATPLPPNKLHEQAGLFPMNINMSEEVYNKTIKEVADVMRPFVEYHGASLVVDSNWNDETVNAYANQSGNQWYINMFGGLARRPEITPDGFAFVVCHEIGHHLGGFPFYDSFDWAAAEGQADYFAVQTCLKTLWSQSFDENKKSADTIDAFAKIKCDAVYPKADDQYLCYRVALAGKSFADLAYAFEKEYLNPVPPAPAFSTPDKTVVDYTDSSHPYSQCRLDTFLQGSTCSQHFDLNVIPGKDVGDGRNSLAAEKIAAMASCTTYSQHTTGFRPACWYKDHLQ